MVNERAERVKHVGTALALILAPLIYMIGQALQPGFEKSEAADQVPVLIEHNSQGVVSILVGVLGLILFIPAVLGLMRLVRERGAWLGLVGGSLAIGGLVLFACSMVAYGLVPFDLVDSPVPEAERPGVERTLQVLIDNAQKGDGAIGAYIGIGFALLPLGLLLTAIGLWRARAVPRWVAVVIAVGAVSHFFGINHWVRAATAAVLLVGMGAVGVQLLRERAGLGIAPGADIEAVATARL